MNRTWSYGWLASVGLLLATWTANAASADNPQILYDFCRVWTQCTGGASPGEMVRGPDGKYYGTVSHGGNGDYGFMFQLDPDARTIRNFRNFSSTDGGEPTGWLKVGSDGNFYGVLRAVGSSPAVFYRMGLNKGLTRLATSDLLNGTSDLAGGLVEDDQGNWYGASVEPNEKDGKIYRISPGGGVTVIYTFPALQSGAAHYANGRLVYLRNGNLYGTTNAGGRYGDGTLFRITRDGIFTTLHSFKYDIDGTPFAPLAVGPDQGLYGTTALPSASGSTSHQIGMFRMSTDGKFTTLAVFGGEEARQTSVVVQALTPMPDGFFYGLRSDDPGGTEYAEMFRISTTGEYDKLTDNFAGGQPSSPLLRGFDNALYGTTLYGGPWHHGTIYRLVPPPAPPVASKRAR